MKAYRPSLIGFFAFVLVGQCMIAAPVSALPASEGLALTPPMGWSSWNYFGCWGGTRSGTTGQYGQPGGGIDAKKTMQQARAMCAPNNIPGSPNYGVSMKDCGFRYINLDDCYLQHDRVNGGLVAKPQTFPMGIKAIGDSVRALGLKFGIYTCVFDYTCADKFDGTNAGQPGMWKFEQRDADTFVAWGVDYVKVDFCGWEKYISTSWPEQRKIDSASKYYARIGKALRTAVAKVRATTDPQRKDILLSICEWGFQKPYLWGDTVGHMWRTFNDLAKDYVKTMDQLPTMLMFADSSGPGGWNDPDMLQVGNLQTDNESKVHFCLWSIMPAPLIAGNDLTNMTDLVKNLFTNKDMARVNQDPWGKPARLVKGTPKSTSTFVLAKELNEGSYAVLFVNNAAKQNMSVTWEEISKAGAKKYTNADNLFVYDLAPRKDLAKSTGSFSSMNLDNRDCFYFIVGGNKWDPNISAVDNRTPVQKANALDFTMAATSASVTINSSFKNPASISLVDLKGAVLHSTTIKGAAHYSIPLQKVGKGIYFVSMKSAGRSVTKQLIVR